MSPYGRFFLSICEFGWRGFWLTTPDLFGTEEQWRWFREVTEMSR
jgi:hypothetical protein